MHLISFVSVNNKKGAKIESAFSLKLINLILITLLIMLRVLTMETLYSSTANGQKCVTIADN